MARAAPFLGNYRKGSIETILTLSTPHQRPPASVDARLSSFYATVNGLWRGSVNEAYLDAGERTAMAEAEAEVADAADRALAAVEADKAAKAKEVAVAAAAAAGKTDAGEVGEVGEAGIGEEGEKTTADGADAEAEAAAAATAAAAAAAAKKKKESVTAPAHRIAAKHWRWRRLHNIVVVSIAGGLRDALVFPLLADLDGVVLPTRSLSVLSRHVSDGGGVQLGLDIDHLCILWCKELTTVIAKALHGVGHVMQRVRTEAAARNTRKAARNSNVVGSGTSADRRLKVLRRVFIGAKQQQGEEAGDAFTRIDPPRLFRLLGSAPTGASCVEYGWSMGGAQPVHQCGVAYGVYSSVQCGALCCVWLAYGMHTTCILINISLLLLSSSPPPLLLLLTSPPQVRRRGGCRPTTRRRCRRRSRRKASRGRRGMVARSPSPCSCSTLTAVRSSR